jgi:hypothetical protein
MENERYDGVIAIRRQRPRRQQMTRKSECECEIHSTVGLTLLIRPLFFFCRRRRRRRRSSNQDPSSSTNNNGPLIGIRYHSSQTAFLTVTFEQDRLLTVTFEPDRLFNGNLRARPSF